MRGAWCVVRGAWCVVGLGQVDVAAVAAAAPLEARPLAAAAADDHRLELRDELRGHLEDRAADLVARGVPEGQARRRARIELSGRIGKIVRFRVDREFAHGGGWRNLWVGIEPVEQLRRRHPLAG